MKGEGGQMDPPPEKNTIKKSSLIRVKSIENRAVLFFVAIARRT